MPPSTGSMGTMGAAGTPAAPVRIPIEHRVEACARLLGDTAGPRSPAGKRMIAAAAGQGIDLGLIWGTVNRAETGRIQSVRQCALLVPGSGKTAMLLTSHPLACGAEAERSESAERAACINAACAHAASRDWTRPRITLAQALPDPQERWATQAFTLAGFRSVGDLAYLRRSADGLGRLAIVPPTWPEGVTVRNVQPGDADEPALLAALERSYIDTLDCPELCGLRETTDVLESHRSTGQYDPRFWWLVFLHGQPHGCLLLNMTPELTSLELVYLGLSPELRGKGVGRRLLSLGLGRAAGLAIDSVSCAVDLRNAPAMALYHRLGFEQIGLRTAMVKPLAPSRA